MKITTDLIRSKIARRFCLLFFFCALIPTFCLFFISFNRVTGQLEKQSYQRIKQETKAYGLSLFDRLIRAESSLKNILDAMSIEVQRDRFPEKMLGNSMSQIFVSLEFIGPDKKNRSIVGNLPAETVGKIARSFQGEENSQIYVLPGDEQIDRVFIMVADRPGLDHRFLIIGEVKPDYLWGIGTTPLLSSKTEFSVYGEDGRRIAGSISSPGPEVNVFHRDHVSPDLRVFRYSLDSQRYLASSWLLFVKSNFTSGNWTIVLAESEESILAGVKDFRTTFLLITLLALLITLFLSLTFIRRNLAPLHQLRKGTELIAQKNFSVSLDIHSGDEFEELGSSFNSMTTQLRKQFNALAAIDRIDRAILSSLDQKKVIDTSLRMLKDFFQADCIFLGRIGEDAEDRMRLHILEHGHEPANRLVLLDAEGRKQILAKQPFSILDVQIEQPKFLAEVRSCTYVQFVCLPLIMEKQLQSVLIIGHNNWHEYDDEELKQARQLADQLTIGLSNAQLVADQENLIHGTIEALARTVDAKSKWTAGHSERVAELAGRIGQHMGLQGQQIDLLHRGGLLHDIGKIGIPMALLDKPEKLTLEEFGEIKAHPLIGQKILDPIKAYKNILPMIGQHHERYDGSGYPLGLAGQEIDILARILIVADVYDALVSNRPYRAGWVHDNAVQLISKETGTHFDPEVVKAFLQLSL